VAAAKPWRRGRCGLNPGEVRRDRDVGQLRAVETPRGPRAAARDVSLRKRWPEEAAPRQRSQRLRRRRF
jgi:hypothetical protein